MRQTDNTSMGVRVRVQSKRGARRQTQAFLPIRRNLCPCPCLCIRSGIGIGIGADLAVSDDILNLAVRTRGTTCRKIVLCYPEPVLVK